MFNYNHLEYQSFLLNPIFLVVQNYRDNSGGGVQFCRTEGLPINFDRQIDERILISTL